VYLYTHTISSAIDNRDHIYPLDSSLSTSTALSQYTLPPHLRVSNFPTRKLRYTTFHLQILVHQNGIPPGPRLRVLLGPRSPHLGAGKGLGYQIALSYARAGASGIAISSRTLTDLEGLEREIMNVVKEEGKGRGIEVLKTVCDVRSEESVKNLEREIRDKWGRADVVVANAGVISQYIARENAGDSNLPIGIVEDDDWARVLDTNIMGVWRISM
jgi:hypothetical protein